MTRLIIREVFDPLPPEEMHRALAEIYRILVEELGAQGQAGAGIPAEVEPMPIDQRALEVEAADG